ncbi:MAG: hypothetical protein VX444_15130 [Pseudomonadota bacterium]|nr:hypothetical protein [Pseudomonadota bacterium]
MFRITALSIAIAAGFAVQAAKADPVGVQNSMVFAEHHGRDMLMTVYYPAAENSGQSISFAENPVFFGTPMFENAAMADGTHPVVLMSHGLGGRAAAMSWLAAGLVQEGAIVIGVDHPNSTFRDFDMLAGMDHWTRVQDLQVALDTVAAGAFGDSVDMSRLYATGFSFGGWTALSMGGLRSSADGYALYCDKTAGGSTHCNDLQRAGVDLRALDAEKWSASYQDARISAVAAIDPAFTYGVTQEMADELIGEALLITLGEVEDRLQATDVTSGGSGFEQKRPDLESIVIAPAFHFSALPLCKPEGEKILEMENDDPVCTDPEGADRKKIHADVIAAIASHFDL